MRFLICCNGQPPAAALLHQAADWADVIVAADGGANVLLTHEIVPDLITGDMDSYSSEAFQRYLRLREQDESDLDAFKTPELIPNAIRRAMIWKKRCIWPCSGKRNLIHQQMQRWLSAEQRVTGWITALKICR